eukprot:6070054-Amphidinium_carterae.1
MALQEAEPKALPANFRNELKADNTAVTPVKTCGETDLAKTNCLYSFGPKPYSSTNRVGFAFDLDAFLLLNA